MDLSGCIGGLVDGCIAIVSLIDVLATETIRRHEKIVDPSS